MAGDDNQAAGGSKKKLLVIGVAALLLFVGGGVGAMFMFGDDANTDVATQGAPAKPVEAVYVDLKPEFVINFRDRNNRPKFLKADIAVATHDSAIESAVTRHMPAIRNKVVLLLSRQIYEDLVPNEGKAALQQQALAGVQSVFVAQIGKPGVEDLYFSNFIMH
jgi:flagellar protein FliL